MTNGSLSFSGENLMKGRLLFVRYDLGGMSYTMWSSRHRDIIVRTQPYHYGPEQRTLVLTPEHETYTLSPLKDTEQPPA